MNYKMQLGRQPMGWVLVGTVGWLGVAVHPGLAQNTPAQNTPAQNTLAQNALAQNTVAAPQFLMAQSTPITGSWRLVNMTAPPSPMPMLPSSTTELTADFADGRLSGSGGCNRFMGGYQTQGNQLSIGPLASTFMACESDVMAQETQYLTALQGAQRYEVSQPGELQIFYQTEAGSGVLRFTAQPVQGLW